MMAPVKSQGRHDDDGILSQQGQHNRFASEYNSRGDSVLTNRRHNDESWVEIASQPSSSSLSSIGDEIVTAGLRVGHNPHPSRRNRTPNLQHDCQVSSSYAASQTAIHAGNGNSSSQEEYDETESEDDHVLTSSMEHVFATASMRHSRADIGLDADSESDEDDVDENATALGRPSNSPTFRPQPNAFSHPPSHLVHRHSVGSSSVPHQQPPHPGLTLSSRSHTRHRHRVPSFMSPSYQADHDAALRASLTTLLSCAAAARGLSKRQDEDMSISGSSRGVGIIRSNQLMDIRVVPESELMKEAPPSTSPAAGRPNTVSSRLQRTILDRTVSHSAPSTHTMSGREREHHMANVATDRKREGNKRIAAVPGRHSSPRSTRKKARTSDGGDATTKTVILSPALLALAISAGIVLGAAVGLGAGYVIGRRHEAAACVSLGGMSTGNISSSPCGADMVGSSSGTTLKKLRWGAVSRSTIPV